MSQTPHSRDPSLPFAIQKQIDAICDRFEAAWKAGNDPRLEEYLDELSGSARTGLLSGLLAVEIEYRRDGDGNRLPDDLILAAHPELSEAAEALKKLRELRSTESHDSDTADALASDSIPGYTIVKELNRGGQGVVYQAIQKSTHRKVALKVMLEGPFAGPDSRHRFEREVALVGSLRHPNIVPVFDSGVAQGRFYYAMEYVRGKSLKKYVQSEQLSLEQTLQLFKKVCDAVNCAHQRGVIHRDLKPTNILVDDTGAPHILDFGLAKVGGAEVDGDSRSMLISVTGQVIGTLPYMCPEQAAGRPDRVDMRSDVYALGVILYELLTGTYPYDVKAQMADVLANILKAEPRRPSTIGRHINDEVETIILKTLSKEKERRYDTAGALGRDIEHYLSGEPIDAKRDSALYVLRKTLRRYKVHTGVAAGFIVLVTAAAVGMSLLYAQARRLSEERNQSLIEANEARGNAEKASHSAEEAEREARRLLYISDMNLAGQAWENNDIGLMEKLLGLYKNGTRQADFRSFEWYYLQHLAQELKRLPRLESPLNDAVAFSNDGTLLAVGHTHGSITLWRRENGVWKESNTYGNSDSTRWYTFIAFSPDETRGRILAYPSENTIVELNVDTQQSRTYAEKHKGDVWAAAFSNDGNLLASAGADARVIVWDVESSSVVQVLSGHERAVRTVAFSPTDRSLLASGSADKSIRLWRLSQEKPVDVLDGHSDAVWSIAFSPNGRMLASGSSDNTVRLWDLETSEAVEFHGHRDEVRSVAFAQDGQLLASGSRDRTIKLWKLASKRTISTLRGHSGSVQGVTFSPSGDLLVSAGSDRAVVLWDAQSRLQSNALTLPGSVPAETRTLAFLPTSDLQLVARYKSRNDRQSVGLGGDSSDTLLFWNLDTGKQRPYNLDETIFEMAISEDGRLLAGALGDGSVRLWQLPYGDNLDPITRLRSPMTSGLVTALGFSAEGNRLAAGTIDGSVFVWNVATGETIASCADAHASRVTTVTFAPDEITLASGAMDRTVSMWRLDLDHSMQSTSRLNFKRYPECVAFSSDGTKLAVGMYVGHPISIYDVDALDSEPTNLVGHSFQVQSLAFSESDRVLVSAGCDGLIKLWDVRSGRQRLLLDGHTSAFTFMDLSKDGTALAAVDRSNTIHVCAHLEKKGPGRRLKK